MRRKCPKGSLRWLWALRRAEDVLRFSHVPVRAALPGLCRFVLSADASALVPGCPVMASRMPSRFVGCPKALPCRAPGATALGRGSGAERDGEALISWSEKELVGDEPLDIEARARAGFRYLRLDTAGRSGARQEGLLHLALFQSHLRRSTRAPVFAVP